MTMIPKIIHYCWFGGKPLGKLEKKCIESWKKFCPGYEIKKWDESNFDINCCDYVKEAYKAKKWAFVSDYARFKILYENGGLYFDTDVELIKPIDDIISIGSFMACEPQEIEESDLYKINMVAPGLGLAANPGLGLYKEIIDDYNYDNFKFSSPIYTVVKRVTKILQKKGFSININSIQKINDIYIYPPDYFCPMNYYTEEINITDKTVAIHHYDASWVPMSKKISKNIKLKFGDRLLGKIIAMPFTLYYRIKIDGVKKTYKYYISKLK